VLSLIASLACSRDVNVLAATPIGGRGFGRGEVNEQLQKDFRETLPISTSHLRTEDNPQAGDHLQNPAETTSRAEITQDAASHGEHSAVHGKSS